MGSVLRTSSRIAIAIASTAIAHAQVPPEIAKQLLAIGRGVCPAETAEVYRPLHPNPPYKGVSIARDISFGPDAKNVLDVFAPEQGAGSRPVLIYVSGGAGNKRQASPNEVFYDNIMLWAVKNGMTGVNMQRRPGQSWDDPAKDVSLVVQWVSQNITRYKGNPERVFIWSQSAGNVPASTYVGHPEFYGPKGVGLKGAIFMSAATFNILPAAPPAVQGGFAPCGQPTPGSQPAAAGGGDGKAGGGQGKQAQAQPDGATLLARSNLPGLIHSNLPFLVSTAELDPPSIIAFAEILRDALCKAGRCPTYSVFKDHSHISEVMSPDTADTSVTGPILQWMKSVK
jgi:BD-FAE protein